MASKDNAQGGGNVTVVCRFRPMNNFEKSQGTQPAVKFDPDGHSVEIVPGLDAVSFESQKKFSFDHVYGLDSTQKQVYDTAAKPIIDSVLEGFNGTIFAYGQTSSGKTHTMSGPDVPNVETQGIIPRMVRTVFNRIQSANKSIEFTVKVAMTEIYKEKIRDLLQPQNDNLKVREDKQKGVYIADLTEVYITEEQEIFQIMEQGNVNRSVAATNMNERSSRSHSMFILTVKQQNHEDLSQKTGTLYLVDLAGSEKIEKTGAQGETLEEAKMINKSLSALGKVIYSLTDPKATHIPYRDSQLTRILSESLGGNSKTCLVITCSPHPYNVVESIGTMKFGLRAKSIKNKPKVNREFTVPELKKLLQKKEEEVGDLQAKLKAIRDWCQQNGVNIPDHIAGGLSEVLLDDDKPKASPLEAAVVMPSLDDELQAKQDEIEVLNDQIVKEQKRVHELEVSISDFTEEFKILQEQTALEKRTFLDSQQKLSVEHDSQISKLQKQLQESQSKIQELTDSIDEAKNMNDVLRHEKNYIKNTLEKTMGKLKTMQNDNILIPKSQNQQQMKTVKTNNESLMDVDMGQNLQDEIRRLHSRIKSKDEMIKALKGDSDGQAKLPANKSLLAGSGTKKSKDEKEEDIVIDNEYEEFVIQILNGKGEQSDQQQQMDQFEFKDSCYLTPAVLKEIHAYEKQLSVQIDELTLKLEQKEEHVKELLQSLEDQNLSAKDFANIQVQEVTDRLLKQNEAEKLLLEKELSQVYDNLKEKIDEVIEKTNIVDDLKEHLRQTDQQKQGGVDQKKIQEFELQMMQLNHQCQQYFTEKSNLKLEFHLLEKKVKRTEEKLNMSNELVLQRDQKIQKQKVKIEELVKGMLQLKDDWNQMEVAKKIKQQQEQQFQISENQQFGTNFNAPRVQRLTVQGGGGGHRTMRGSAGAPMFNFSAGYNNTSNSINFDLQNQSQQRATVVARPQKDLQTNLLDFNPKEFQNSGQSSLGVLNQIQ